jgi:hypothetical protein
VNEEAGVDTADKPVALGTPTDPKLADTKAPDADQRNVPAKERQWTKWWDGEWHAWMLLPLLSPVFVLLLIKDPIGTLVVGGLVAIGAGIWHSAGKDPDAPRRIEHTHCTYCGWTGLNNHVLTGYVGIANEVSTCRKCGKMQPWAPELIKARLVAKGYEIPHATTTQEEQS